MTTLPNGIGGSTGAALATAKPLYASGSVYYVDSVNGDDSDSGLSRLQPKASLSSAQTAASDDDIIVLLDGHAETLTGALTISKRLTVVAEGQSSGKPTVKLTNNQAGGSLLTISATDVQFHNIWFEEESQGNSAVRITTNQARTTFKGCYFEADDNNNAAVLQVNTGASDLVIDGCTFISTEATSTNSPPTIAVELAAAMSQVLIKDTVFSGGTMGWSDFALKASAAAITRVRGEGVSMLLGADADFHTSSTGYFNPQTNTGGARVNGLG